MKPSCWGRRGRANVALKLRAKELERSPRRYLFSAAHIHLGANMRKCSSLGKEANHHRRGAIRRQIFFCQPPFRAIHLESGCARLDSLHPLTL
jgi:hypothetical protein